MKSITSTCITSLAIAFSLLVLPVAASAQGQPLGSYNPEESCDSPVGNPVCAYKTWFFCRVADQRDMCSYVLGRGQLMDWDDKPWLLPLSELISGPLAPAGYAFIGALKVDRDRLSGAPDKMRSQLMGTVEVMDTYTDPNNPGAAFVGSEFYTEAKPGQWTLVGWSIGSEGGDPPATECDSPKLQNDAICKLRVTGLKSWVQMMRSLPPPK